MPGAPVPPEIAQIERPREELLTWYVLKALATVFLFPVTMLLFYFRYHTALQVRRGDDCIAIKSGRNRDGRRVGVPTENVVIRNCRMKDGHGGVTIGSEMSGGVRNIFIENCRMDSPRLDQALRFKTNAMRGGTIEHVSFMRKATKAPRNRLCATFTS